MSIWGLRGAGLWGWSQGSRGPKGGALGAGPRDSRWALGQSRQSASRLPVTVAGPLGGRGKKGV